MKKQLLWSSVIKLMTISILVFMLNACKHVDKPAEKPAGAAAESAPAGLLQMPEKLYSLTLTKAQVDHINSVLTEADPNKKDKWILQFVLDTSLTCKLTMGVFPSKKKNDFFPGFAPEIMACHTAIDALEVGNPIFLGDQQISKEKIIQLIDITTGGTGNYTHILFTPRVNAANRHVFYVLTALGAAQAPAGPTETQPSPPANAD